MRRRAAAQRLVSKVPIRIGNSPTNPFRPGQRERRERDDEEEPRVDGDTLREPSEGGDLACVAPLVEEADEEEERPGGQPVVHHLDDAAGDGDLVQGEDPEHDEAHVAHRRVRDEALQVGLHERDDAP
jgi:hypothetical protein